MYAYAVSLKIVPIKAQELSEFIAANPWTGNPQERWTLSTYRLGSETFATSARWRFINQAQKSGEDMATRRQKLQQKRKLGMYETLGFEAADGRVHTLPRMLNDLWLAGEVPDATLPRLLKEFEPTLKRSDFKMKRLRLIFKVEAYMFLVFALAALTGFLILHGLNFNPHQMKRMPQAEWLGKPMAEGAIWAEGQGTPAQHCWRLRSGSVPPPAGLHTYGPLNLLCAFQAEHESRLALMEAYTSDYSPTSIILRGAVLPPSQFQLSPQLMSTLAQKVPNLNTNLIFVYNVDWGGHDILELGELATILLWACPICAIPFLILLVASRFWRKRDLQIKEQFRAALGSFYAGVAYQPAVNPL